MWTNANNVKNIRQYSPFICRLLYSEKVSRFSVNLTCNYLVTITTVHGKILVVTMVAPIALVEIVINWHRHVFHNRPRYVTKPCKNNTFRSNSNKKINNFSIIKLQSSIVKLLKIFQSSSIFKIVLIQLKTMHRNIQWRDKPGKWPGNMPTTIKMTQWKVATQSRIAHNGL